RRRGGRPRPPPGAPPPGARPPKNPREELLCRLFSEALDLPVADVDADFFELGGHSLGAARLIDQIRDATGVAVGLPAIFAAPTVAGLAEQLDTAQGDRQLGDRQLGDSLDPVLPIRATGTGPALFCVGPAAGLSWSYRGLVDHLAPHQRIYGLQTAGLREDAGSIEQMAEELLEHVRAVQPEGPYLLLGWSVGGLVAFALATELQARGVQVNLVALLDSYPLAADAPSHQEPESFVGDEPGLAPELRERLSEVYRGSVRAARRFTPRTFRGDVLHVAASGVERPAMYSADAWQPYVSGRIERHEVACGHEEMTRPGPLAEIARWVTPAIEGRNA
ncbi:hypothetical protein K1W54_27210, partial [Micromonospora sp. CPCC 205371]|nr:hypothetical protein [Micromonospora sp. CPCC 205371]